MFERYTEAARRSIFFARYEASNLPVSGYIETEHLLLGILREDPHLRAVLPRDAFEQIRRRIEAEIPQNSEKPATSVDMPLSHPCKRALSYGAEEAETLGHIQINNGHLVLGLLRLEDCLATKILNEHGITLESYREQVSRGVDRPAAVRHRLRPRVALESRPVSPRSIRVALAIDGLERLMSSAAIQLDEWSDEEGAHTLKRKPWTRKQAIGHLVDWAAAHQQWLATALTEPKLVARCYPADEWVTAQHYAEFPWERLVELWVTLNRLLIHVIAQIPDEKLSMSCRIGIADPLPLSELISRYVDYCEDLIGQILIHG